MPITRRSLIHHVGRAGGVAAVWHTMSAMGLLPVPAAYAGPPQLAPGNGTRVLILGAGIAGMVAAYELGRAGYDCTILEARARAGGRNWSVRGGDVVQETGGVQPVTWDAAPHLYLNPGPARLPCIHDGILAYCRDLGVVLEVMINDNRNALMQDDAAFGGVPQRSRAVINDSRGYVAELAAKATAPLDRILDEQDLLKLRGFLRVFGALDADGRYKGSSRSGFQVPPGAEAGTPNAPLDLKPLLHSAFWKGPSEFGEFADQAATMMQPVGGMGRIGEVFARAVGDRIVLGAEVTQIRRTGDRARVVWRDAATGQTRSDEAPHVICTIPFSVLRDIDADFTPEVRAAIAAVDYVPAGKLAFEAQRRFWEDEGIYGGISWTSRDITQVWYPSAGIFAAKGIFVGAYVWSDDTGARFAGKTPAQRIADGLDDIARLHPAAGEHLQKGVSVAWPNIPYSRGAWAEWSPAARQTYAMLQKGDGPVLFAGEHMSFINGWQEGALRSAHAAIAQPASKTATAP